MTQEELVKTIDQLQQISKFNLNLESFRNFLSKIVNGDSFVSGISRFGSLGKDRRGILAYVLTSAKLVEIEIDSQGFKSSSYYLKQVTGVNRSVSADAEGNKSSKILIEFGQDSIGLRYPEGDEQIDSFFSAVEKTIKGCEK